MISFMTWMKFLNLNCPCVLKSFFPNPIKGWYIPKSDGRNAWILFLFLNFISVGLPEWFYREPHYAHFIIHNVKAWWWLKCKMSVNFIHNLLGFRGSECNSSLWIVIQRWNMSLNFETIEIARWPERNWRMLFVP